MLTLFILVAILCIFDIYGMYKKGQKKEMAVYICMAIIALIFGYFYTSNSYTISFSQIIMDLLGINF